MNILTRKISIHAPPRGATDEGKIKPPAYYISIHAPPRGATSFSVGFRNQKRNFNSRPSARGDYKVKAGTTAPAAFQFTPLREGRHGCNPDALRIEDISIHAPPRGATTMGILGAMHGKFQFTPLREGRPMPPMPSDSVRLSFQFTPLREGRRLPPRKQSAQSHNFNSRPSARGDAYVGCEIITNRNFNSRPSARGDSKSSKRIVCCRLFQFTPLREGRRKCLIRERAF